MIRALRLEWYTVTRNKTLIIMIIASVLLFYFFATFAGGRLKLDVNTIKLTEFNQDFGSNFSTLDDVRYWFNDIGKRENQFHTLIADGTFLQFLCFFFAAIFIGIGFSNRTINMPLISGISRQSAYLSKCILFYLVTAFLLIFSFLFTLFSSAGIPYAFTFSYVLKRILLRLIIDLATLSPTIVLAYLFHQPIKIACSSFAYFAIVAILERISYISQYVPLKFIHLYLSKHVIVVITPVIIVRVLVVSSIWILTSIIAGWLIYCHKDLK